MSSDVAAIRAEIKAWERSFKETNGKEPTIDDIKKQPAVGLSRPAHLSRVVLTLLI